MLPVTCRDNRANAQCRCTLATPAILLFAAAMDLCGAIALSAAARA